MGMNHRQIIGAGAIAVALTALAVPQALAQDVKIAGAESKTAIADSYIVVLKDDVKTADAVAAKVGAEVKFRYTKALNGFAGKMTEAAAKKLAADPAVRSVTQDQVATTANNRQTPTPSWGLDRIDQRGRTLTETYGYRSDASNVHAYIIDTGIKIDHPDFGNRASWDVNSVDTINTDCHGHGTHVAGTVGGASVGVAKGVKLHAVKVLDCGGGGSAASVIAGIDWVTANAVKPAVANMSLSFREIVTPVDDAVRNSIASGISYALASANASADACVMSPGRVTEAITVNASNGDDDRAYFSNWGSCTDIFAPGVDIYSAHIDNSYKHLSGTSMASPHVAGAAALHLSANPAATPAQVQQALKDSATSDVVKDVQGSPNKLLRVNGEPDLVAGPDRVLRDGSLGRDERITSPNGRHFLVLQQDGNLVLYSFGQPKFASNTSTGSRVWLQGDGNFVLYDASSRPVWASNTTGSTGTRIVIEDNGQAVLYGESYAKLWVSHNV